MPFRAGAADAHIGPARMARERACKKMRIDVAKVTRESLGGKRERALLLDPIASRSQDQDQSNKQEDSTRAVPCGVRDVQLKFEPIRPYRGPFLPPCASPHAARGKPSSGRIKVPT